MKYSDTSGRYALLDELRGLDLVSMMLYHGCWDLVNLFGIQADWYYGLPGHLWQQSICWVFILLSGFCVQLGHHTLRRGAQVFGAGALVTAVTLLFMQEDRVIFGVLTLLGSAMLLTVLLEKQLRHITPASGCRCGCGTDGDVLLDMLWKSHCGTFHPQQGLLSPQCCLLLPAMSRQAIWVLEACAVGCRRHCMQTALQRTLAFIRGGSILRIILPFCRGCFCSGRGTFYTTLKGCSAWRNSVFMVLPQVEKSFRSRQEK